MPSHVRLWFGLTWRILFAMGTQMTARVQKNLPEKSPPIILIDIDGTLLAGPEEEPSAGFRAMIQATKDVTGNKAFQGGADFSGRTDLQISSLLLRQAGVETPSKEMVLFHVERYLFHLEREVVDTPYTVLGDPQKAIAGLEQIDALWGLGTGNVPKGARIKFASAGLEDLFDYTMGGFGGDAETRTRLLEIGMKRLNPLGRPHQTVVVGDTPRDVRAALELGAKCLGVPYRHNSKEVLIGCGAHGIIDDVGERLSEQVLSILTDD